ncbi:PP2C family serine/threonine-protein phosphatase [Pseudomonas sp. 43(2021)]|uniref:PP2C family protein-serine/threonine phosphatase n=1 Tax=Pseudomonas sp. 43(2021) TaxID=2813560 RepID=UPI001A9E46DB|nr:PP2C family serine/threonine-protein phosphatase [Pseudomonas sp. 43(2021)]
MINRIKPLDIQLAYWLSRQTSRTGVRRVAQLDAALGSDIGMVRSENQDRAVVAQGWDSSGRRFALAVVADGIGGMRAGAACASLAVSSCVSAVYDSAQSGVVASEKWLTDAFASANNSVFEQYHGEGGSTLVAALIRPGYPTCWASVGDSRVYISENKSVHQLSVDDTIAGQLDKSIGSPEQSKLLQYVGMGSDLEPHVHALKEGQQGNLILVSDGVHYLGKSSDWFERLISFSPDAGSCAKRLIELANWCGGPDNATVVILPTSSQQQPIPPAFDFLEIWDSYGEVQFFGQLSSKAEPEEKALTGRGEELLKPGRITISRIKKAVVSERSAGSSSTTKKDKIKVVENKKSRALKKAEVEEPQLTMEFPNRKR